MESEPETSAPAAKKSGRSPAALLEKLRSKKGGNLWSLWKDVGVLQLARVAASLCSAVQIALVARFLTPTQVGLFGLIVTAASLCQQVFDSRAFEVMVRYYARFGTPEELPKRRSIVGLATLLDAAAGVLGCVLLIGCSSWIASLLLHDRSQQSSVYIAGLTLLLGAGQAGASAVLAVEKRFDLVAWTDAGSSALTLLVTLLILLVHPGVDGLLMVQAVVTVVFHLIRWRLAFQELHKKGTLVGGVRAAAELLKLGPLKPHAREITRFALGTNFLATLRLVQGQFPTLYLGWVCAPALASYYLLTQRTMIKISSFALVVQQASYPRFGDAYQLPEAERPGAMRKVLVSSSLTIAALVAPFFVIFFLLAHWTVPLLFGPRFVGATPVIQLCVLALTIAMASTQMTPLLTVSGKVGIQNIAFLLGLSAQMFLLWWLAPTMNSMGAAWAFLAFQVIFAVLRLAFGLPLLRTPSLRASTPAVEAAR